MPHFSASLCTETFYKVAYGCSLQLIGSHLLVHPFQSSPHTHSSTKNALIKVIPVSLLPNLVDTSVSAYWTFEQQATQVSSPFFLKHSLLLVSASSLTWLSSFLPAHPTVPFPPLCPPSSMGASLHPVLFPLFQSELETSIGHMVLPLQADPQPAQIPGRGAVSASQWEEQTICTIFNQAG